eukprot:Pgem_evm1s6556
MFTISKSFVRGQSTRLFSCVIKKRNYSQPLVSVSNNKLNSICMKSMMTHSHSHNKTKTFIYNS